MAKSKRTPDNEAIILEGVRLGLSYKSACEAAGISVGTFCDWKANDSAFMERITRAANEGKRNLLDQITRHAREDWRAAAWILSHRHPEEFSEKRIIETKQGDSPFMVMVQMYNDEQAETETAE